MNQAANLRTTAALSDLRAQLVRFRTSALGDLHAAERELVRVLDRLSELNRQVGATVRELSADVDHLEAQLAYCEEDCDDIADDLARAQRELATAEALHQRVRKHQHAVTEQGKLFLREQRALIRQLEHDVPKGELLLGRLIEHVERYAHAADMSGTFTAGASTAAGQIPDPSLDDANGPSDARRAHLLQQGAAFLQTNDASTGARHFRDYKAWEYLALNTYLRTGEQTSGFYGRTSNEIEQQIEDMTAAFGRFSLNEPETLYRGVRGNPRTLALFGGLRPGSVLPDPGFLSTTLDQDVAAQFAGGNGFLFRIWAPPNTRYVPLSFDNDGYGEAELVLPPGTRMMVIRSSGRAGPAASTVIDAVALPPGTTTPAPMANLRRFAQERWKEYSDERGWR